MPIDYEARAIALEAATKQEAGPDHTLAVARRYLAFLTNAEASPAAKASSEA